VIIFVAIVLVGPTKIVQSTRECGFLVIAFFGPTEILSLIVNEYLDLEFWLDQPKIYSLVVNANFCS
jgi:hypothetical protein